ncbi:MAG TPA: hypothetical protein V6D26_11080, partial [Stenomitos sp.]
AASRSPGWLFNENLFKSLNTITHPKTLVSTPEGHANPNRDYWTDALGTVLDVGDIKFML